MNILKLNNIVTSQSLHKLARLRKFINYNHLKLKFKVIEK